MLSPVHHFLHWQRCSGGSGFRETKPPYFPWNNREGLRFLGYTNTPECLVDQRYQVGQDLIGQWSAFLHRARSMRLLVVLPHWYACCSPHYHYPLTPTYMGRDTNIHTVKGNSEDFHMKLLNNYTYSPFLVYYGDPTKGQV